MTLTETITGLSQEVAALTSAVAGTDAEIRQHMSELAAMVPSTSRTFYVDEAAGDDTAEGNQTAPLASVDEALSRAVPGGQMIINLLSDVTLTQRRPLLCSRTRIVSAGGGQRTITAAEDVQADAIAGLYHVASGVLEMENVHVLLPALAAITGTPGLIYHYQGGTTLLRWCAVSAASGCNTALISPGKGLCVVDAAGSTLDATAAGHLFEGVAAGADPNAGGWRIKTNITEA